MSASSGISNDVTIKATLIDLQRIKKPVRRPLRMDSGQLNFDAVLPLLTGQN
jgi:hypothetical protein